MNASHLAFAAAFLLCAAAVAWLVLSEHPVVDPGAPRTRAEPVRRLEAAVPSIAPFKDFNVNDENPFIPYNQRLAEKLALQNKPKTTAPQKPAVEVLTPAPKPLPRLGQGVGDAPRALGVISRPDGSQQLVLREGGGDRLVAIGGEVGAWALVGIENGSVALWRDARGRVARHMIGDGDGAGAVAPATAPASKPAAKPAKGEAKPSKPAKPEAGKPSGQPRAQPVPPAPQAPVRK